MHSREHTKKTGQTQMQLATEHQQDMLGMQSNPVSTWK